MRMLVGDIGGTNARLIMYEVSEEQLSKSTEKSAISHHKVVSQMYYKNDKFDSFSDVIWQFINLPENHNIKVHSCCFAVAGPVNNNQINFTNREGWIVDGHAIEEDLNIDKVQLLNDFVANGYGLLTLSEKDLVTIQKGNPAPTGSAPIALLGAGTGLGKCFLTPTESSQMKVYPTEGGHVEFSPRTALEIELLEFLQKKLSAKETNTNSNDPDNLPRVSVERVVSGKGLENIYDFLREKYPDEVDAAMDANFNKSSERGRLIGSEKYNYKLFKRTLEMMFAVYGGDAGNVALSYLPQGGVYICGGIAPKNLEFIQNEESSFLRRFLDKGRMSSIMKDFPVYVVLKEDLGLRGAHAVASQLCKDMLKQLEPQSVVIEKQDGLTSKIEDLVPSSFSDSIREAIRRYPMSYAFFTTVTASVTAGAFFGAQSFLLRKNSSSS